MRTLPSPKNSLKYIIYILLFTSTIVDAERLRISLWDWDLYLQQNAQIFRDILWEIGRFKTARQTACTIGGPNDSVAIDPELPTSLYYLTGTLKITLREFQNAVAVSEIGSNPMPLLETFGFANILSARHTMRKLEMTVEAYEVIIKTLLESGEIMDEFPSAGSHTTSGDGNTRALAVFMEDAWFNGVSFEGNLEINPDMRRLLIEYWKSLAGKAQRQRLFSTAGVEYARKHFDADGFTAQIKHRSGIPQIISFKFTISGLLQRIEAIMKCWMMSSERVLAEMEKLGPLHLSSSLDSHAGRKRACGPNVVRR